MELKLSNYHITFAMIAWESTLSSIYHFLSILPCTFSINFIGLQIYLTITRDVVEVPMHIINKIAVKVIAYHWHLKKKNKTKQCKQNNRKNSDTTYTLATITETLKALLTPMNNVLLCKTSPSAEK